MSMPINLDKDTELLKRIVDYIGSMYGDHLLACALIGSRANGYAKSKSDVDLHVVLKPGVSEGQLGLRRQTLLDAEVHFLAILDQTLMDSASDVQRQPMENVCLTLFSYAPILGDKYFAVANDIARKAELVATLRWLSALQIAEIADPARLLVATIIRKLTWAPPLVERWERKVDQVGFESTWDAAAANLKLIISHDLRELAPAGISPSSTRTAFENLRTLTSRHGNLTRDTKAVLNGALYGPMYLALTLFETKALSNANLPIEQYLHMPPPDGLAQWLTDSSKITGVARARRARNRIKDYIV